MNVRYSLQELGDLAVEQIGFCIGVSWRSVTGSRVPEGMVSARCRLAYVLFSGFAPAFRFHELLAKRQIERLPRQNIRLVRVEHVGTSISGVAVIAVVSPDSDHAEGFQRAPAHQRQPGYQRYFQDRSRNDDATSAWWDEREFDTSLSAERFSNEPEPIAHSDELGLELLLDQLEAEYDEKLWWYGVSGRRTKYPPALGSVQELVAYARKRELTPDEVARRNRERQSEQWLSEQHRRDRVRQQELDADQAEIAVALRTPRRGRKHSDDASWLLTAGALEVRRGLRYLYRDAAPRTPRPREA
jgi:hypothetical protein